MGDQLPKIITEIIDEVQPGYWKPQTFEQWRLIQLSNAIIPAWRDQQDSERVLRKRVANWIFSLITFQVLCIFIVIFLIGFGYISISETMVKVLMPFIVSEVFGMGLIVVKYLFSNSIQIDKLLEMQRE